MTSRQSAPFFRRLRTGHRDHAPVTTSMIGAHDLQTQPPPLLSVAKPPLMERDGFVRAATHLTLAALDGDLCGPFVDALEVTGAAIATLGRPLGAQTVGASDPTAARIAEIQIDLGEGPCWVAVTRRAPVFAPDLQRWGGDDWPGARDALRATGVGSLHAFPLFVGAINVGSVGLYTTGPCSLTSAQIEGTSTLARIAARQVLRRAMSALVDAEGGMPEVAYSRREAHQAAGMIAAQMKTNVDDAALVLRAHAYAEGRTVLEVAEDVVSRRLTFVVDE